MKREVRDKKEELYKQTKILKNLYWEKNLSYEKGTKLREEQTKTYNKYLFFKNLIKAEDKIKCKNQK
jgi:hypothetical protein